MKKTLLLTTTEVPVTFIKGCWCCKNGSIKGTTFVLEDGTFHHELFINCQLGEFYLELDNKGMMSVSEFILKGLTQELTVMEQKGVITIKGLPDVKYMPS